MFKITKGLVLRETNYKEADKMLTVLTESDGKVSVSARGTRRKGSRIGAASQLLAYSEMTLFCYKGRWSLNEANTIELFPAIRGDIELLALGSYFAELLEAVTDEDQPNPEILSLGLNSLYALGKKTYAKELIKAAFEIRLICLSGYEPELDTCVKCGSEDLEGMMFGLQSGGIHCPKCAEDGERSMPLCPGSLSALRYIVSAEPKKLFSFRLGAAAAKRLADIAEAYILSQLERGFKTLEFYKNLNILGEHNEVS